MPSKVRPQKVKVDRGIYRLGPDLFEVYVPNGKHPVTGAYLSLFRRHRGTITSARAFRRQLLAKVEAEQVITTSPTVSELLDLWLADLERRGRAPKTVQEYRADADRYWRPAIGELQVHKVLRRQIRDVLDGLTDRGVAAATVHHVHACISSAFSYAVAEEWIERDPTKGVPRPPKENVRPIVPTPEQVVALISAASASPRPEMARVIWLGAITGIRNSELRGLRLTDFDLERGRMGIDRAISAGKVWTTKNRKWRDNSLDRATIDRVLEQIDFMQARAAAGGTQLAADAYLFSDDLVGRTHWREETITKFFSKLADDHGLGEFTFKHLRKFMDTYGQEVGFTVDDVADRAGHSPEVARKHYTGVRAATDLRLSAALADLLAPKALRAGG